MLNFSPVNFEEMKSRIAELKRAKNAIILAHNYQLPEIYDVADFVGDSFELAMRAHETNAEVIVFAGVKFMAESAKILNPQKKVLLPDLTAGCPLADFATAEKLRERKKEFPKAGVVAYVNSSAAVKAESDACCTSANAVEICRKLPVDEIIFVPDRNLGEWVAQQLPQKKIILWKGHCFVHSKISVDKIETTKKLHPNAIVLVHPECSRDIRQLADEILGTGGMLDFVKKSEATEFLIATESGMLERLRRETHGKKFFPLAEECAEMKKITLAKILNSLENNEFEIEVDVSVATAARRSLEQCLDSNSEYNPKRLR